MEILGVRVDNFSRQEILEKIESFLNEQIPSTIPDEKVLGKFHQVATVNPEFILAAQKNLEFKKIVNNCDLNIADGFGISLAFLRFSEKLKCRFAGADLVHEILKMSEKNNFGIFLAINKNGLSSFSEIKAALTKLYPNLKINGADLDPLIVDTRLPITDERILLCNYGAPDQEMFLNCQKNDRIGLAIGVGGTFDFVTEKARRAPVWMQKVGLEWLWRGIIQPKNRLLRWKRILSAIIIFPIKIILNRNA